MYRAALWIIGEYALSTDDVDVSFSTIQDELGPLPFVEEEKKDKEKEEEELEKQRKDSPPSYRATNAVGAVLSDGTYATQSALTTSLPEVKQVGGSLRTLLEGGDFFVGAALAVTLTKLVITFFSFSISVELF